MSGDEILTLFTSKNYMFIKKGFSDSFISCCNQLDNRMGIEEGKARYSE